MERQGRRRKQLLDGLKEPEMILGFERGSIRSHSVEKSLWKSSWTRHKRDRNDDPKGGVAKAPILPSGTDNDKLFSFLPSCALVWLYSDQV